MQCSTNIEIKQMKINFKKSKLEFKFELLCWFQQQYNFPEYYTLIILLYTQFKTIQ